VSVEEPASSDELLFWVRRLQAERRARGKRRRTGRRRKKIEDEDEDGEEGRDWVLLR